MYFCFECGGQFAVGIGEPTICPNCGENHCIEFVSDNKKPCEYCKGETNKEIKSRHSKYDTMEIYQGNLDVDVEMEYGNRGVTFEINYCPMCGRKL